MASGFRKKEDLKWVEELQILGEYKNMFYEIVNFMN